MKKLFTIIVFVLAISLAGQEKKPLQEVLKENHAENVADMFSLIMKISKPMIITQSIITGDNELLKLEKLEPGIYEIYIIINGPYYHFNHILDLSILPVFVDNFKDRKYSKHERFEIPGFNQCGRGPGKFEIKDKILMISLNPIFEKDFKNFEKEALNCTLAIYKKI